MNARTAPQAFTPEEQVALKAEVTDPTAKLLHGTIHIPIGGKGGSGKSICAALLMEKLHLMGLDPLGIDTDTNNKTLSLFGEYFRIKQLQLLKPGTKKIDLEDFDLIAEYALADPAPMVIDIGANTFNPLLEYMADMDGIAQLKEIGRTVILHVVVAGGDLLEGTAKDLVDLHREQPGAKIVVWLNEWTGSTDINGRPFVESKIFENVADVTIGLVKLRDWNGKELFQKTIRQATKAKMPVWALEASEGIMTHGQKQRVRAWANDAFEGIAAVEWASK